MYCNDYKHGFGVGVFVGTFAGMILLTLVIIFVPGSILQIGQNALETCQKSLPRDQRCIITAIPEEK